ncbi:Tyrosine-protein kinase JAK2 [Rhizoctonia solani]|uniref:Tyrosine-protein kinase JAK2 n=1 Tax=Rhizoctonia solani TaxID=456999 RepID=A0A0K6FN70_9AGAM|nr:Tyrosine-protein kinase JAK2 [Rhizoctonia solani]
MHSPRAHDTNPKVEYLTDSDGDDLQNLLSSVSKIQATPYVVASLERNAEFHEIFSNVPLGDRLIEDYKCSIKTYIHTENGRLYISESHIGFYSEQCAQAQYIIPFHEVTSLKKMTRHAIPNTIKISTRDQKYIFTDLLSRNTTYEAIRNTWRQWACKPIKCACGKAGKHPKQAMIDSVIPGTPRAIYNLMFMGGFMKEFMDEQGLTDIQISDWHPKRPSSQLLVRDILYAKFHPFPLGGSFVIKRELKDEVLHIDFDDYISVLTTMRLANLPSEEFMVETRICIMRAGTTTSRLLVTTQAKGYEDNFLLSPIESLVMHEQKSYYVNLERAIYSHITTHTTESNLNSRVEDLKVAQESLPSQPLAKNLVTSGIPQTAYHPSVAPKDSTDPTQSSQNSVNGNNTRLATDEHASPSQYPDKVMDILQSESPQYVASVMYGYLIHHGCFDLESSIDPSGFSLSAVAEGGFGDIWTGRSQTDGTKLAIKVLRFASLTGDTARKELKRITREIYNWSKLDHENVNKLIGVIMFRERLGMVSEWMEHGNLRQYLNRNASVDRHQLCTQIARGAAYLHSVNMVHGDLKACNILVSSAGILKITDFDYSIFPECSLAFSATSRMGGGTLRWMAPELLLDEEPPQRNLKTDIYALGMTFLETITNAHPYSECQHDHQIYRKLWRKEHPKRSEKYFPNTEWGNGMWNLLLECWNFNPASRPTADTILSLLLTLENGTMNIA